MCKCSHLFIYYYCGCIFIYYYCGCIFEGSASNTINKVCMCVCGVPVLGGGGGGEGIKQVYITESCPITVACLPGGGGGGGGGFRG